MRDRKAFVVHMLPRLARMRWWEEDADGHMTVEHVPDEVSSGEVKEFVLVCQDESTMYENEGRGEFFMEQGKRKILPKTKGRSIMVSGFTCPCHGFMSGTVDGEEVRSYRTGRGAEDAQRASSPRLRPAGRAAHVPLHPRLRGGLDGCPLGLRREEVQRSPHHHPGDDGGDQEPI